VTSAATSHADVGETTERRLRVNAERARIYLDRAVAAALTAPFGTLLLAWIQSPVVGWELALKWFCVIQACELLTIFHGYRYRRKPSADSEVMRWVNRQVAIHAMTGLIWGASAMLFHVQGEQTLFMVNLLVLTAVTALCVNVMSPYRRAYFLFAAATWLLPLAQLLSTGTKLDLQLALGALILVAVSCQYAWIANRQLVAGTRNLVRNAALVEELSAARQALAASNQALESRNADLSAAADSLGELASRDDLTGAYNRRFINVQLEQQVALKSRYNADASLVVFDLDHFKQINDTHGHPAGDAVLREVAARVRGVLREGDLFARFGGEEFIVLLPVATLAAARAFAERLRLAFADQPMYLGSNDSVNVTASFGVAELGANESASTWVDRADKALYRAKQGGRNRVEHDGETAPVVRRIV
jgi:diguanylate cyclase (GGDEF)-like protein